MDGDDFLSGTNIAIVGLGLMGGSLAMALKGHCATLRGLDSDDMVISQALERKVVDTASSHPKAALPGADIIILATPVGAIIDFIHILPEFHPGPAIVLDIGSTKTEITSALEALPQGFDPIGGHPMCGSEKSGLAYADPQIFRGATFAFTPLERTSQRAKAVCTQITEVIGARALWLDPFTHDRWTASTSHIPYLVASALAASTPREAAPMVGPGFRSTTRLAASSTRMMRDILATNRQNVLPGLKGLVLHLEEIEKLLAQSDFDALETLLDRGLEQHNILVGE